MIVWRVRWTGPVQPSIRSAPSTGTFGMSFSVTTFMTALPRLTGSKLSEIRSPNVPGNRLPRAPSGCKLNGVQLAAGRQPKDDPYAEETYERSRPPHPGADPRQAQSPGRRRRRPLGRVRPGVQRADAQGGRRSGGRRVSRRDGGDARLAADECRGAPAAAGVDARLLDPPDRQYL